MYQVSGIHINRGEFLPLPTIPVAGETREDLAEQVALGYQILSAASGKPAEEIYKDVDLNLSDSTNRNKYIGEDVAELFKMDTKAGQVFCSTHTNLGMCLTINTCLHQMEKSLGIGTMLESFLATIEFNSKNGSLTGQFVDCICTLVGKELKHKPWNYGTQFKK